MLSYAHPWAGQTPTIHSTTLGRSRTPTGRKEGGTSSRGSTGRRCTSSDSANEPENKRELCLGVNDMVPGMNNNSVPQEDVANIIIAALEDNRYRGRSFDLVSKPVGDGVVTNDYSELVKSLAGKNCDYSLGEIT